MHLLHWLITHTWIDGQTAWPKRIIVFCLQPCRCVKTSIVCITLRHAAVLYAMLILIAVTGCVLCVQENSKIRELQSENIELRQSLSDHQSALEVIMTKYREQMANLARANQVELSLLQCSASRQEVL